MLHRKAAATNVTPPGEVLNLRNNSAGLILIYAVTVFTYSLDATLDTPRNSGKIRAGIGLSVLCKKR